MAVSAKIRKRQQRARDKVRGGERKEKVQQAIDAMPLEWMADCKMWIAPPRPDQERPTVNWDIGAETNALIEDHAKTYGVTLDEVLLEIGVLFCIKRPDIYWAMKAAKINA